MEDGNGVFKDSAAKGVGRVSAMGGGEFVEIGPGKE